MTPADRQPERRPRPSVSCALTRALATTLAGILLLAGCIVDAPSLATDADLDVGFPTPTADEVDFLPTPTPVPAPTATAVPEPTPLPEPTATPEPAGPPAPTAIVPITPVPDAVPSPVAAGQIVVPVGGETSFVLASDRPLLQLPGHTLIYVDDARQAEVDIFTPVALDDGTELADYQAVIAAIEADPAFAAVTELSSVSIAGLATRVFEGTAVAGSRSFYTDVETIGNDSTGWFPPSRIRMWVIDAPAGAVVVSAESLTDPGQYSEAVRLATEILTTITFSS